MNIQPTALRIFNLQTLQKLDRNIKSLVLSGGQVTAYLFDSQTRTWVSFASNDISLPFFTNPAGFYAGEWAYFCR